MVQYAATGRPDPNAALSTSASDSCGGRSSARISPSSHYVHAVAEVDQLAYIGGVQRMPTPLAARLASNW